MIDFSVRSGTLFIKIIYVDTFFVIFNYCFSVWIKKISPVFVFKVFSLNKKCLLTGYSYTFRRVVIISNLFNFGVTDSDVWRTLPILIHNYSYTFTLNVCDDHPFVPLPWMHVTTILLHYYLGRCVTITLLPCWWILLLSRQRIL